jgi:hypothetical protein
MEKKNKIVAIALALSSFVTAAPGQGDCVCAVVNKATVTTASGSCPEPGQGSIKCFVMTLGSFPGAGPATPGSCIKQNEEGGWVCGPTADSCTFHGVRMFVTAAPCSASCGAYHGMIPKFSDPFFEAGGTTTLSIGGIGIVDVKPSADKSCGSPKKDVSVEFKSAVGAVVFELRVRFSCLQCKELATDG